MHLSTHTAQALANALRQHAVARIGLEDNLYVTTGEPTTEPSEAAPARHITRPPTYLRLLPQVGLLTVYYANTRGKSPGFRRGMMLPCGSTPIRPITGRPSLAPSSSTRSPIGGSCDRFSEWQLVVTRGDYGLATFRRCHGVGYVALLRRRLDNCAGGVRSLRTWPGTLRSKRLSASFCFSFVTTIPRFT